MKMQGLRYSVLTRNLRLEGEFDLVKIARVTPGFVGADLSALCNKACNLAMQRVTELRRSRLSKESADGEDTEEWWRKPWLPEEVEKLSITMADFEEFGVDLETGFLLYGPPGCGKTLIAKAVANEAGTNFIHIKVDALTTKQGKERGWVVERLLNQLLIELDGAEQRRGVYVVSATIEVLDRAVLRPGRFGKLLYVPLPTPDERSLILKALGRKKPIDPGVDLLAIGKSTACENISGADLAALMNEASMAALEEKLASEISNSDASPCTIKATHSEQALMCLYQRSKTRMFTLKTEPLSARLPTSISNNAGATVAESLPMP